MIRQALRQAMRILGSQFVLGRDHRGSARQCRGRGRAGLSLLLRHAGRGGAHRGRRRALRSALRAGSRGHRGLGRASCGAKRRGADRPARALGQALGAASALSALASKRASNPNSCRGSRGLALAMREAWLPLTIDAEEADRLDLSLALMEPLFADPALVGLERAWARGAGLQQARAAADRLARRRGRGDRPAHPGAPGQGRLLGQRDQMGAGSGARRLSGVHPQGQHRRRLSRRGARAAGAARLLLSAIRHPQRPHHRRHRHARRRSRLTSSSGSTAWARRCIARWCGPSASASHAASMRRSAAIAICSPISCAGCWRTAPTLPSSIGSPTTRRRSRRSSPIRWRRRRRLRRKANPLIPLPPDLFLPERKNSLGLPLWDDAAREPLLRAMERALADPADGQSHRRRARASRTGARSTSDHLAA